MEEKEIFGFKHVKYSKETYDAEEMKTRSKDFYDWMSKRRTVRDISDKPVPLEVIKNIVLAAGTAPSGAHKQPWTFCVVANPELKKEIREAAEKEETESYESRMSERWKDDLKPMGTDAIKPFLEKAPYLIIIFKKVYDQVEGEKVNNYYVNESVGIACGFILSAIHKAGLVTVTHTPSPMNFLTKILERPVNERPFLLLPVGYPEDDAYVPRLDRKELDEIMKLYE
ncbi:MAG: nitroreductase family protein [Cyclobacteriaceae bacterium]